MSILYQTHEVLAQEPTSETTVAPMNEALETTVPNVQIQGQPVPKLIKIDAEGNLIPKNAPVTKPVEEKTKLKATDPPVIHNVRLKERLMNPNGVFKSSKRLILKLIWYAYKAV